MKLKTKDLTGRTLDYVVATIDPQNEGLEFKLIENQFLCGTYKDETLDGRERIAVIVTPNLTGTGGFMRASVGLGASHAVHYHPSSNLGQLGPMMTIMVQDGFELTKAHFSEERFKFVRVADDTAKYGFGESIPEAMCRAWIDYKIGPEVDVPDEFVA